MSRAQFQDALASGDPKAFGAVGGADGLSDGRDAVLAALRLGPAGGGGQTMPMRVPSAIAALATAGAFGESGAEIAVAVLRGGAGPADVAGHHASPATTMRETRFASAAVFGVRGTANGVTATIAFSTVSVREDAAPEGVSLIA